ncbi:hypothetical protein DOE63_19225 [Salmonella enterica subsp. diarizonae serovar 59:z10:-]|nr:hypothetical protein DOE63_19225 [Salmonella enterica subsp. diarizonae serovar 59:z10:-]
MKKLNLTLAVAAALATISCAHAHSFGSTSVQAPAAAKNFTLATSYAVSAGTGTPTTTFTINPDLATKQDARDVGHFTISNLAAGADYVLGDLVKTGPDAEHVTGACFSDSASNTTCDNNNKALIGADSNTVYVQLKHDATAAVEGVTNISIPVTAYLD